jgi:hypothetical protein
MHRFKRFDFIETPFGGGYVVALNGRRVEDTFGSLSEVLSFARALGIAARYSGTDWSRITAEGGQMQVGDENFVQ